MDWGRTVRGPPPSNTRNCYEALLHDCRSLFRTNNASDASATCCRSVSPSLLHQTPDPAGASRQQVLRSSFHRLRATQEFSRFMPLRREVRESLELPMLGGTTNKRCLSAEPIFQNPGLELVLLSAEGMCEFMSHRLVE